MNDQFVSSASPDVKGFVFDYNFASPEDIRNLTKNHLAKLEAELHTLRMAYVANGRNPELMIGQGRKLGTEMQKVQDSIKELTVTFQSVLDV